MANVITDIWTTIIYTIGISVKDINIVAEKCTVDKKNIFFNTACV